MIYLSFSEEYHLTLWQQYQIKRAVKKTLRINQIRPASCELTIKITGIEEIKALNQTYRNIDAPTDVLSFESDQTLPDSGKTYLGDIILSYPIAVQQAQTAGHSVLVEILVLVIHGSLHLLGYDHGTPEERTAMWNMQDSIFARINIHPRQLPE